MNGQWIWLLSSLLALFIGIAIGFMIKHIQTKNDIESQKAKAGDITKEAREKAKDIELQARDSALEVRQKADSEVGRRRQELSREEDRLQKRREELDVRTERLEKREQTLNKRQSAVDKRANEIDKIHEEEMIELQRISQMSEEDARAQLLSEVEKYTRNDMARIIRQIEAEAREEGTKRARELITTAIQRVASDHVSEVTTSSVPLPTDDMKGRIIGRNGRNIHAFEQAAGVDVIVDDTPEAVTISCFDPVRREIARRSLSKLVLDGRIHPAYIEKVLRDEEKEVNKIITEAGEQAAFDTGVSGLHPEITRTLGRLKYRTSYGQNQLDHAVETSKIAVVLAAELGANIEIVKAGALLHDLGKALDHNIEGTHAQIGAEFALRHGIKARVVNTIAAHHHEVEQEGIEAAIVEAADAISGARPGARRESLEHYIKRVRALEEIANSYKGVKQSYALQAGREVRIFVKPEDIDDLESINLARDISKQIEESMQYPGQIKVTVIRETRAIDYAK
jgi:ribonuclease Y